MNPLPLFLTYAWLAIISLACTILSTFWLPMLIGAVVVTFLARLAGGSRS